MHRARFSKLLLAASVLATAACGVDRSTNPPVDGLTSRVKALGFSVSGMKDYGSYVVVEGDIRLEKAILLQGLVGSTEGAPSPGKQAPKTAVRQYSTNQTVSQAYVQQITIDLTNISAVSDWASAVRTAIDAYNTSGSNIHMSEASPGDITYYTFNSASNTIAIASWPYQGSPSGKPGPTITVNTYFNTLALNQKQLNAAHELGHTLGLRHDNALVVDSTGVEGANLVSGTPQSDGNSIMLAVLGNHTWVGFSNYDLVALTTLYPAPPPLSVTISGPQYVTLHQSAQYFATPAHGTAPYTYEWRSRQCADGGGYNCGAWQNWFSTGAQNYTYASVNGCNIARNELQARVTDAVLSTATSYTYPIWITNPC
jgi:hypothetical protein